LRDDFRGERLFDPADHRLPPPVGALARQLGCRNEPGHPNRALIRVETLLR
jgi:hypothetical protein